MKRNRLINARLRIARISSLIGVPFGALVGLQLGLQYGTAGLLSLAGLMLAGWVVTYVILGIAWSVWNHNER